MSKSEARRFSPSEIELDRRAFRLARKRKSTLVAFLSTVAFAVIAWFSLVNSPGWPRVEQSFFNWETAVAAFPAVIDGLLLNLRVLLFSAIGVLVFGLTLALLRTLRS
ncbi:MAG: amino acid ABC transporter permease, partial [Rhodoluna sp.]